MRLKIWAKKKKSEGENEGNRMSRVMGVFASPSYNTPFSGTKEDEHQARTLLLGIEPQQSLVENLKFFIKRISKHT